MAEAFAIVGLASNVIQFVDAAGNLLSGFHELYRSGSLADNVDIEERTNALRVSLEILQHESSTPMDTNLKTLVHACIRLSTDLTALVEGLKPNKQKNKTTQALLKSLRTIRKRQEIKSIEGKLEKLREAICCHLAILLKQNNDELTISIKDLTELTKTAQYENRLQLDVLAIDVRRMLDQRSWENGDMSEFTKFASHLRSFMEEVVENKNVVRILKSLHFKQIKERHSDIPDAHRHTLEWIFNPSSGVNFTTWLSSTKTSNGIYWVTGKAGSGKSTLMKFIQRHPETERMLRTGSPNQDIIIATHYFWSAGTSLQKSQMGLFRTLLFQILSQRPSLIPLVAAKRWGDKSFASLESWSRGELQAAFKQLALIQPTERLKICLFVDGLDEYDGDHRELANVFCVLSQSPHLKLCLSSRPWQDFIDAFGKSEWTLRVQDLTKNDIKRYITDNLEQEARFLELRSRDRGGANELARQIQEKAQGIFLWVYLVVRSLIRGLVNRDGMEDLQRRLNDLPTELEKYFELMLDTIEPLYQRQNARVFRVMLASIHALPIVAFDFVNQAQSNANAGTGARLTRWSSVVISTVIDQQQRQLNAICRDLIHITTDPEGPSFSAVKVGFLHRTVMDFLRTSPMEKLLAKRSGERFDPNMSLCETYWALYRVHPFASGTTQSICNREYLIAGTLHYAREVERQSGRSATSVLDDMNRTIPPTVWHKVTRDSNCKSFFDVAVRFDLELYVVMRMRQMNGEQIATLLRQALRAELSVEKDDAFEFTRTDQTGLPMLQCLLENGADPNAKIDRIIAACQDEPIDENIEKEGFFGDPHHDLLEHDRSVWADYLFALQVTTQRRAWIQPDWDMNLFLERTKPRKMLEHAFEACELLISYHARRDYHATRDNTVNRLQYLRADDALSEIFPDEAGILISLLDKMGGKPEEEPKGSFCNVM